MTKPIRVVALSLGLACLPTCAFAQTIASAFDTNVDGWTAVDTPDPGPGVPPEILAVYTPTFLAAGGDPGGYLQLVDPTQGPTFYWRAPAKFLGNVLFAYGGYLRFDLRDEQADGSYFMAPDVILTGAGLTLEYFMNTVDYPIGPDWASYSVDLVENNFSNASGDGSPPTHAQILSVLGALDGLYVRGEYLNGTDTASLDNPSLNGDEIFMNGYE